MVITLLSAGNVLWKRRPIVEKIRACNRTVKSNVGLFNTASRVVGRPRNLRDVRSRVQGSFFCPEVGDPQGNWTRVKLERGENRLQTTHRFSHLYRQQ